MCIWLRFVGTEGSSLAEAVRTGKNSDAKKAAFSQWWRPIDGGAKRTGYNIYTTLDDGTAIRYTEWVPYNRKVVPWGPIWPENDDDMKGFVELFNRTADPNENINLADQADMKDVIAQLRPQLRAGWRGL